MYMDETSTNSWELGARMWINTRFPHTHQLNKNRGKSVTLIGGIAQDIPLLWDFGDSTNLNVV